MTTEPKPYVPFTAQQGLESYEIPALDEHVTPHLAPYLWQWCRRRLEIDQNRFTRMILQMRLQLGSRRLAELEQLTEGQPDRLLNIAQWYLTEADLPLDVIESLDQMLSDAGSAWTADQEARTLRRRMPPEEEESLQIAIGPDDATSTHLREAWTAAWRREDPSALEAFDRAVKAIESILTPIVTPTDPTPTVGKIIAALRDKPEKWDTRFRGVPTVEALTAMLDEVWKTQVRHGKSEYLENTLEEAQDAVSIAVAVVSLCRRGFLRRLSEYTAEEEAEDLAIADAALERYQSGNMKTVSYEDVIADWTAKESSD